MLLRNKIQGVAHGLKMKPGATASRVGAVRTKVEASYPTPGVPNMPRPAGDGILSSTSWGTEYLYYMTGLLPAASPQYTDSSPLIYMFRDMYLYDSVAGAAIDIQSTFPFSDFELRGLPSKELRYFWDSIERLNLRRMMPEISIAHLTDGFFCGSLIFDPKAKQFMDVMVHDALQCSIEHNPFYNADPTITVTVPPNLLSGLSGGSTYLRRYLKNVPEHFLQLIMQGKFIIDPLSTLYIPRKGLTDRAYVSYLQRILPMYLVEKAMFRGTLTEAHRRQRAMTHITVGDGDVWIPEDAEIEQIVKQFMIAEQDPLGGWIGTRDHVQSTDLRPAGDFWKWTDMVDTMVDYKLRALGISEAFLSGDASYASSESAFSTFLESQDAYRSNLTNRVFYQKLFPLISVVNELYVDDKKPKGRSSASDFLYNATARGNLKIPELIWNKELQASGEDGLIEMLEILDEKGVPIPLKMWISAAGVSPETLLKELGEDEELRTALEELTGKDTSYDRDEVDALDEEGNNIYSYALGSGATRKKPLLARDFGGDGLIKEPNRSGSGFKHIINQSAARKRSNSQIISAVRKFRDPNYREKIKQENIKRFGTATPVGAGERLVRSRRGKK